LEAAEAFGIELRARRLEANLTQEQLAFEAEIQRVYVSKLELGRAQPTLTMLLTLARALDCTAGDLVDAVEQRIANAHKKKKSNPKSRRVRARASAKLPE
jgi:transcriptional regulator with XRE-family HTH domain